MIINGRLLAEIGEALHGPGWRAWLGRQLDRSERQIRNYESDDSKVPREVREGLLELVREQRIALQGYERVLSQNLSGRPEIEMQGNP